MSSPIRHGSLISSSCISTSAIRKPPLVPTAYSTMRGAANRSGVCFNNEFGDADTVPGDKGQNANDGVAGKSVSHHHRHSAWQRTERRRVCGDTGMTEMGWATGAYGDAGVTEMGCATGSIYSGDPGVDRSHLVPYHLIIQRITHSIFPIF